MGDMFAVNKIRVHVAKASGCTKCYERHCQRHWIQERMKSGLLETALTPRDCDDEVELDLEMWNELPRSSRQTVAFEDYVGSDCAAATSAELTCEEIASQVQEQDCCSSDEDDTGGAETGTTEETISSLDAVVFLEKAQSYLGCCKNVPDDILRKVADVEAYMHQRLLSTRQKKTDFSKQ
ncbi:hypothetical protein HPB52_013066 [Rhipicephalus sanguineus]|uniref:Uncharacterized protein n=1 Tax=Rhipicephalus sanguineus TaxID=34632 RepID=A0A9D4TA03_RHISA|nr:hypothetical protein HPB52_013066 [Rhipicephalus sanguineus]